MDPSRIAKVVVVRKLHVRNVRSPLAARNQPSVAASGALRPTSRPGRSSPERAKRHPASQQSQGLCLLAWFGYAADARAVSSRNWSRAARYSSSMSRPDVAALHAPRPARKVHQLKLSVKRVGCVGLIAMLNGVSARFGRSTRFCARARRVLAAGV